MKKRDLVLAAALFAVAASAFMALRLLPGGTQASVRVDGRLIWQARLDGPAQSRVIDTPWGQNTVEIGEGQARILSADCSNQSCVRQRAIDRRGQALVCLPHRLVVSIEGSSGVDGISGGGAP
nr:NusG domain II-containing protein [bacterium]